MYFVKPVLFSFFCTAAFAGLDDVELTRNEMPTSNLTQRYHYQDDAAEPTVTSKAYASNRYPTLPMFHTYHHHDDIPGPTGYRVVFTAALSPDSWKNLPENVKETLEATGIINPQVNVVLQSMNEYLHPKPQIKDHSGPLLFRPHYFLQPDAPNAIKGTYKGGMQAKWTTLQPGEPARDALNTEGFSLHGPGNSVGATIASPHNTGITAIDNDETKPANKNAIHDFFTVVEDQKTKKSAVTLHWLMSHKITDMMKTAFSEATGAARGKPTMTHVFDELEGKTGLSDYKRNPSQDVTGIGADRIARLKSLFTGEGEDSKPGVKTPMPSGVNPLLYIAVNPGLWEKGLSAGNTPKSGSFSALEEWGKDHYEKYSTPEQREEVDKFDPEIYKAATGLPKTWSLEQLVDHAAKYGIRGGKAYSKVEDVSEDSKLGVKTPMPSGVNPLLYIAVNPGLWEKGLSAGNTPKSGSFSALEEWGKDHYEKYSTPEQREEVDKFDPEIYKAATGLPKTWSLEQLVDHAAKYGIRNGKVYK